MLNVDWTNPVPDLGEEITTDGAGAEFATVLSWLKLIKMAPSNPRHGLDQSNFALIPCLRQEAHVVKLSCSPTFVRLELCQRTGGYNKSNVYDLRAIHLEKVKLIAENKGWENCFYHGLWLKDLYPAMDLLALEEPHWLKLLTVKYEVDSYEKVNITFQTLRMRKEQSAEFQNRSLVCVAPDGWKKIVGNSEDAKVFFEKAAERGYLSGNQNSWKEYLEAKGS